MKKLIESIKAHTYGADSTLVKVISAKENDGTVTLKFEITENIGTKKQKSHEETYRFEIVERWSRYNDAETWYRLDEIDDTSIEAYHWAESYNQVQRAGRSD